MRKNKKRYLLTLIICLGVVLGFLVYQNYYTFFYTSKLYKGDGEIIDNGFWTYPRYFILFPYVNLRKNEKWAFSFSGVPPCEMCFGLYIFKQNEQTLFEENVFAHYEIVDDKGTNITKGEGFLKEWTLEQTSDGSLITKKAFYIRDIKRFAGNPKKHYKLIIIMKNDSKKENKEQNSFLALPYLTGWGGNEFQNSGFPVQSIPETVKEAEGKGGVPN